MKVQPFIVLGEKQRTDLRASLQIELKDWGAAWFPGDVYLDLQVGSIGEKFADYRDLDAVKVCSSLADVWAICINDPENFQQLGSLLIADSGGHSKLLSPNNMLYEVARLAILDLIQRFLAPEQDSKINFGNEGKVESCLPYEAFSPGREALCLNVDLKGVSFLIWTPVKPFLPRFASLSKSFPDKEVVVVGPREAVANQQLTALVTLGGTELTIGVLANLKIGDVIMLDKDLQEPLSLVVQKTTATFSGYLGSQGDLLAFQIESLID